MAPQPKKKLSSIRQGLRRATLNISLPILSACAECGSLKIAHNVCRNCGKYNKLVVIKPKSVPKVTRVAK